MRYDSSMKRKTDRNENDILLGLRPLHKDVAGLGIEQHFKIAPSASNVEDVNILVLDRAENNVVAHGRAAQTRS